MEYASGLVSVIGSLDLGEWHAKIYHQQIPGLFGSDAPLMRIHVKLWGKTMLEEEQEWLQSDESTAENQKDDEGDSNG